jgi:HAMP domain-containing protein
VRRPGARGPASLRGACVVLGLGILGVFTVLAVLSAAIHGFRGPDRVRAEALAEARTLAAFLDGELGTRLDGLAGVAESVISRGLAGAEPELRLLGRSFPDLTTVAVLDGRGAVAAIAGPARAGVEWPRSRAAATGPIVAPPRRTPAGVTAALSVPIRSRDGRLDGFVVAEVALGGPQGLLARLRPGAGAPAEILTPGGAVAIGDPSRLWPRPTVGGARLAELVRGEWMGELPAADGTSRHVGAGPVRAAGWTVVVARPVTGIGGELRRLLVPALGGAAIAVILGTGLGLLLLRRPVAELARIGTGLRRLEADDIPANVPVTVRGEVGALGDAFNRTLGWLRQELGHHRALSQVEAAASAAISGDHSLPQVMTNVLRTVVTGLQGDVGIVFLREQDRLVARAAVGLWGLPTDGLVVRRDRTFTGSVLAATGARFVEETEAGGRSDEPHVTAARLRSIVAAPMLVRDEAIGVVEVGYRTPRSFTAAEGERLEAMTRRLVEAVEQARTLEHVPELPERVRLLRRRALLDGIVLPDAVALLIAREVASSVRDLEGALGRILALAELTERELTTDLVHEFFERTRRPPAEGAAAPEAARPAPFLAFVRRGATDLFDLLTQSLAEAGVVEVMWDRRVGPRRRQDQQRPRERRRSDRRRRASIALEGQDYVLVRRLAV